MRFKLWNRLTNKANAWKAALRFWWRRFRLKDRNFSIVANNCWGAEVYKYFDLPFRTPFIGLFLYPDDFLTLLENWETVDKKNIRLGYNSRHKAEPLSYPVGLLEKGIEIHFLHYHSLEEAETKWKKRVERLPDSLASPQVFVRFCDRDGARDEHFTRFSMLPIHARIAYSRKPRSGSYVRPGNPQPGNPEVVEDGLTLFWQEVDKGFDPVRWLNTGRVAGAYPKKQR